MLAQHTKKTHPASALIERSVTEVEDLIAAALLGDALRRLQDLIRDFAPSLIVQSTALREQHDELRSALRGTALPGDEIVSIREAVLRLAYRAEELSHQQESVEVAFSPAQEAAKHAAARPPSTTTISTRGSPGSIDDERTHAFTGLWADQSSIVVSAQNISKKFTRSRFSLAPVSIDLRIGQITGVVGRNASGKTTLLRMLLGDLQTDSGLISYPGIDLPPHDWMGIKQRIGYVAQSPTQWKGSLRENLNFFAAAYAPPGTDPEPYLEWCIARYGLSRFEGLRWASISGGFKTRFELVRVLLCRPSVLVLDEPLANLDVFAQETFLRDLQTIATSAANPIPVIVTSQHLEEIEAISDQIVVLNDGVCEYVGSPKKAVRKGTHRRLHVTVASSRSNVEVALSGIGPTSIQDTVGGYVITIDSAVSIATIFARLEAAFGDDFTGLQDTTHSIRNLMEPPAS